MKRIRGFGAGRTRWLAVFTVLLCASCAAPVLAESPKIGVDPAKVVAGPVSTSQSPASPDQPPVPEAPLPSDEPAIPDEVGAIEAEEAARDKWLESPEAVLEPRHAMVLQPPIGFCELSSASAVLERTEGRATTTGVRLVVNKEIVRPGEAIKAQLLNFSKETVFFGVEFKIQKLHPTGWKTDPSSPDGLWPRRLGRLQPGDAGGCYRFLVPAEQKAGRYRLLTMVDFTAGRGGRTGEFLVRRP